MASKILSKKSYFSNKCYIHQQILNKNVSLFPQKLFAAKVLRRNFSLAANRCIKMISEGSCDTEDWSNDAEYSGLHHLFSLLLFLHVFFIR